jgi:hypothetical protein
MSSQLFSQLTIAAVIISSPIIADQVKQATPGTATKSSDTIPYTLHEEADRTDIFDVPEGTSEFDQNLEMQEMAEDQQYEQNKKKNAGK